MRKPNTWHGLGERRVNPFTQELRAPEKKGPEFNPWFWNPARVGVRSAPGWFTEQLEKVGEELAATWNPIMQRWQIWSKAPRLQHPVCQGWRLLFIHKGVEGEYLPLDERIFARLYAASTMEHGSAKEYFDRVAAQMQRDEEKRHAAQLDDTIQQAMEVFDHSQIKNIGKGNKFSTYHG